MALPDQPTPEHFTADEAVRWEALNRSARAVQRDMADPARWARIKAAIAEADAREPVTMTADQILALAHSG